MPLSRTYTVVIVDDHDLFVQSLKLALKKFSFIKVIGVYTTAEGFLRSMDIKTPQVIFMDVSLKDGKMNGIDATKEILRRKPDTTVVGVSMHDDAFTVKRMLDAGARGYLTKSISLKRIKNVFEHIGQGSIYIAPGIEQSISELIGTAAPIDIPDITQADFSLHQLHILQLIAFEKSDKEIAVLLNVPIKEIEYQKTKIGKKLNARKVGAMIARAYTLGILPYKKEE